MAYVPGYDFDVFISYAHDNNTDGWVTRFQKRLAEKLTEYLGGEQKPVVWFDNRNLAYGDSVRAEIQRILERSAAVVSVISPSYLSSEYCMVHEMGRILQLRQKGGVHIIQTLKIPLRPGQSVPLPDLKYVEFFEKDASAMLTSTKPARSASTKRSEK
jgi:hypothetical protein